MKHLYCFLFAWVLCIRVLSPHGAMCQTDAVQERVDTLISLMSLDEKVEQLNAENNWHTPDNPRLGIPGFSLFHWAASAFRENIPIRPSRGNPASRAATGPDT